MTALAGFGVFCRRDLERWDASAAARRALLYRAAQVRWCGLMVEAVDGWTSDMDDLARVAEVMREEGGMRIALWLFPAPADTDAKGRTHGRSAEAVLELLARAHRRVSPGAIILDLEAHEGRAPSATWAQTIIAGARALSADVAVTSYPIPAWHRTMPWAPMQLGGLVGMPQLYTSGLRDDLVGKSLAAWGTGGRELVPALPAYDVSGGTMRPRDQLVDIATRVCLDRRTKRPRVAGAALWSDPQIDADELRVLADMAERWGW